MIEPSYPLWLNVQSQSSARPSNGPYVPPSASVLAEPPVAWVDAVVAANGREALARAYLEGLYSEPAQALARDHHFRTGEDPGADGFPALELFTVEEIAGGWEEAQRVHFDDGGVFDGIFERPGR